MRFCVAIFVAVLELGGAAIAQNKPSPPPPKNPIFENRPQQPSVWQQIQPSVDRSTGRIVDEPTYQLDRIDRRRDEEYGKVPPQTEFQRFDEERERSLRIELRMRQEQISADRARREELDRREYELRLRSGVSSTSLQAMEDAKALRDAQGRRDQQLIDAQNERADALRAIPTNRTQIESTYQQRASQIRSQYESTRARILGVEPPPTTQPGN